MKKQKFKLANPKKFASFITIIILLVTIMVANIQLQETKRELQQHEVFLIETSKQYKEMEVKEIKTQGIETIPYVSISKKLEPSWESLGFFKTSGYCGENYPHICNNGDSTYTATMTKPTAKRTIAVDPTVIPYGSKIKIGNTIYIAEDCGGAIKGNRIDIFFASHKEALEYGVQKQEIFIERSENNVGNI